MKLEVPNARIMAGELAYISPPAAKLLLTLIGNQDTKSLLPIVTLSKSALASKSGYKPRQIFRLLTELEEQKWITRQSNLIIIKTELSTMAQPMPRDDTQYAKALTEEKMAHTMPRDGTHRATQMSHDPINTEEEEDQITIDDLIPLAECYLWSSRQINSLLKEFHGKSKEKLKTYFVYMQRHADTIDNPYAYIRKCMRNPAQEVFKAMMNEIL